MSNKNGLLLDLCDQVVAFVNEKDDTAAFAVSNASGKGVVKFPSHVSLAGFRDLMVSRLCAFSESAGITTITITV